VPSPSHSFGPNVFLHACSSVRTSLPGSYVFRYAGDYKTMTKRLESKYNDHGFFLHWEDDTGVAAAQKKM